MRFNKKAVAAVQDFKYCHCNHDSSLHDKNGCHGEVVRFRCERRGHDERDDPHGERCIVLIRCACKFEGAKIAKKPETLVLESEKV